MQVCIYYDIIIVMCGSSTGSSVILTPRNENYLFCAVSHYMYDAEDKHSEIRWISVNKIINEWEYHKDFIMDLLKVNNVEDHNFLFSFEI